MGFPGSNHSCVPTTGCACSQSSHQFAGLTGSEWEGWEALPRCRAFLLLGQTFFAQSKNARSSALSEQSSSLGRILILMADYYINL